MLDPSSPATQGTDARRPPGATGSSWGTATTEVDASLADGAHDIYYFGEGGYMARAEQEAAQRELAASKEAQTKKIPRPTRCSSCAPGWPKPVVC